MKTALGFVTLFSNRWLKIGVTVRQKKPRISAVSTWARAKLSWSLSNSVRFNLWCLVLSTSALSTGCPLYISGKYSGRFTSPSYPHNYPNNKNCNWRITVPDGYSVKVVFSHFNTEEGYDYLRIYDGPSASSPLLEKLSGDLSTPRGVISTGSSLWFNFSTNGWYSWGGFEATFTAVNSPLLGKSL